MTQDEIIEMAKQAKFSLANNVTKGYANKLEAFAKLVAEKEREACADIGDWFHDENANCGDLIRARGD